MAAVLAGIQAALSSGPLDDGIHADARYADNHRHGATTGAASGEVIGDELQSPAWESEGVDERLLTSEVDEEWSVGDYVLTGGELAAMVMIDAIARQIPGVLGDANSAEQDSYARGLLDCEHYTRPELYRGRPVPAVLLSGNHEEIRRWRLKRSLGRTWLRRPDLLERLALDSESRRLLEEFQQEYENESGVAK